MSWLCQNWQGGRCYLRVSPKTRTLDAAFLRYPNLMYMLLKKIHDRGNLSPGAGL